MDIFDDEPTAGGGYDRVIIRRLDDLDGIPRKTVIRLRGRPLRRVSVTLEETRDGTIGTLIRFDDAHGIFHRHAAGWPEPGVIEQYLPNIRINLRAPFAHNEIKTRYNLWESAVFGEAQKGGRR